MINIIKSYLFNLNNFSKTIYFMNLLKNNLLKNSATNNINNNLFELLIIYKIHCLVSIILFFIC